MPELWPGAVVVMDNLSSHKLDSIIPMIEAVGVWINICPNTDRATIQPVCMVSLRHFIVLDRL